MSKPTETTNERVPRDIVRIGTTVGKHTEAWGSAWVARRSVAEACRNVGWLAETCGTLGTRGRGAWG